MKLNKLSIPLSMTAALVGVVTCAVSCAKKSSAPEKIPATPPQPAATNAVSDNTSASTPTNSTAAAISPVVTNIPPAAAQEITNPPPAETTTTAANTETNLPGHETVVEMPTATPTAPTNFYPNSMTAQGVTLNPVAGEAACTNVFLTFGAGYEHIYHGDNNDSYVLDAKLYAYGDGVREAVGKNAWLIPDVDAEVFSGDIPKPDYVARGGSDNGLRFRADFTWPWIHWTSLMFARTNSVCPFCEPLTLGLGPTANFGFDHLYNEWKYRFARYAGLRLTFNRSGFIEYTVGDTIGLAGTRQQIVAELPLYVSHDGAVRYYVRGLWNHGSNSKPDELEGGLFLEMPLGLLITPDKWADLVPFGQ